MTRRTYPDELELQRHAAHVEDLPLFAEPLVRSTDPETSHVAADVIEPHLSALQAQVLRAFEVHGPMTAKEAETLPELRHLGFSTVRKRVSELARGRPGIAPALERCGRAEGCTVYRVASSRAAECSAAPNNVSGSA